LERRKALLELAEEYDFLIFEGVFINVEFVRGEADDVGR
jgi:hypothetical protein